MVEAASLKKGECVDRDGEPFRIEKIRSVVTSRHTHTKIKMELTGMFTGAKKALTLPNDEKMEQVDIIRKHGQLIAKKSMQSCQVMDLRDYEVHEVSASGDLMTELKEGDEVTYIEYKGVAKIVGTRD